MSTIHPLKEFQAAANGQKAPLSLFLLFLGLLSEFIKMFTVVDATSCN